MPFWTDLQYFLLVVMPIRGGGGHGGGSSGGGSSGGGSRSGGGFTSGGSGGYSSSSSGGTIGGLGALLMFGFVGLIIFLILWSWWKKRQSGGSSSSTATMAQWAPTAPAQVDRFGLANGYRTLVAKDPNFDIEAFDESARRIFYAVQTAWCERNPGLTRQVMADGLWQAHKQQIDAYTSRGAHNKLDGLAIQYLFIQSIELGKRQQITVRVFADSADYDVDDAGKVLSGNKTSQSWCEDWVFVRDGDTLTPVGGGIAAQKCPNCGAPLDVDTLGNCSYCHAGIMGGNYDWVLYRIDQLSSLEDGWASRGLTAQELEDLAGPSSDATIDPLNPKPSGQSPAYGAGHVEKETNEVPEDDKGDYLSDDTSGWDTPPKQP